MHHRREHVVGRLAAVDVIVGMHRPVAAERLTGESGWRGWRSPRWRSCWCACPSRSGTRPRETRRPRRRRRLRRRRRRSGRPARCRSRPAPGWCRRRRASPARRRGSRRAASGGPRRRQSRSAGGRRSVAAPHRRCRGHRHDAEGIVLVAHRRRPSGLGGSNTTRRLPDQRWRRSSISSALAVTRWSRSAGSFCPAHSFNRSSLPSAACCS